jgi:cytochrome oxidase Cu insertion factor (SCO1/SenC/PrrC family)
MSSVRRLKVPRAPSAHPALMNRRVLLFLTLVVAAVIAAAASFSMMPGPGPVTSGTALVGGPFELTSHTGGKVKDSDFRGKFMLVFFGYTFCPDICPSELQVMSAALDELGEAGKDIQPLFISIDPERDSPAVMAEYVRHFHPRMIGLTGTAGEVADTARAYRVYFARAKDGSPGDYLMDHSTIVYLMDREGRFLKHFSYTTDAKRLAQDIRVAVEQH